MEDLGLITKVTKPTDSVPSFGVQQEVKQSTKSVPRSNRSQQSYKYRTPSLDEITHKLAGTTVFSKLDAHRYWSVKLDDESSILTTFNNPFGRYCFMRLPFGLNLSQHVFQEFMDNILELCPGAISFADDVLVFGHDAILHHLKKTAREHCKNVISNR